ncbi:MAG: hypothetical protein WC071_08130 [Victivallaceae bacterium]
MISLLRTLVFISSLFFSYFMFIASCVTYDVFRRASGNDDWMATMPVITRLVAEFYWIPLVLVIIIGLLAIINSYVSKNENRNIFLMLIALWLHFLIVWLVLFCLCYHGFTGWMCLHHDPEFEMREFLQWGYSFFPITLFALLFVPYCIISNHYKNVEIVIALPWNLKSKKPLPLMDLIIITAVEYLIGVVLTYLCLLHFVPPQMKWNREMIYGSAITMGCYWLFVVFICLTFNFIEKKEDRE